jgi:hypothetical protein
LPVAGCANRASPALYFERGTGGPGRSNRAPSARSNSRRSAPVPSTARTPASSGPIGLGTARLTTRKRQPDQPFAGHHVAGFQDHPRGVAAPSHPSRGWLSTFPASILCQAPACVLPPSGIPPSIRGSRDILFQFVPNGRGVFTGAEQRHRELGRRYCRPNWLVRCG